MSEQCARVTTVVATTPEIAFRIFTRDVDAWWRFGPRFRPGAGPDGKMRFEPEVGGRLLEVYSEGEPFEFGRILDWKPGERLSFHMFFRDFAPGERTRVDIRFEPTDGGTRVSIEHAWDEIRADHPFRHGLDDEALTGAMGLFWGDLVRAFGKAANA